MSGDDPVLGELLLRCLVPTRAVAWDRGRVAAVCNRARNVGLDAQATIRLIDQAQIGSALVTAPAVKQSFGLSRRDFDRLLARNGYGIIQRRAILGLPPM